MSQITKIQKMLADVGYDVELNGPGIFALEKAMPEGTKENPWPLICVTSAEGCDIPPDEGPFLIGYHPENGMEPTIVIELSGTSATELLIPILKTLELNRPK